MKPEAIIAAGIVITIALLVFLDYLQERKDNKKKNDTTK